MVGLTILVTDTNIWIDLTNGGILEKVFKLPCNFLIPDFAISEFSKQTQWEDLLELGAIPGELNGPQVAELLSIRQVSPSLSTSDVEAFILARDLGAVLLTGDGRLRKMALNHDIQVHGVLWLLDELIRFKILDKKHASETLLSMMSRNPRLPKLECQNRLLRWAD